MKLFKFTVILSALLLVSAVAWAGNIPEYDAVGQDDANFFAKNNVYYTLINDFYAGLPAGHPLIGLQGIDSDFTPIFEVAYPDFAALDRGPEDFDTNAGQLRNSFCYPGMVLDQFAPLGGGVAMTDAWNQGIYEWWIVLQLKPETDINLNIYDCVLKHNSFCLWGQAEQTGRYRADWGELMFVGSANPLVSVTAIPGPFATSGFAANYGIVNPFIMDARTLPNLTKVALDGVFYTSKAHFPEGIVMALPKTGEQNTSLQNEYNLKQGDVIHVKVEIPYNNTVDVFYGPESVLLKYVGIVGTELLAQPLLAN
jgi:hypothetical protein